MPSPRDTYYSLYADFINFLTWHTEDVLIAGNKRIVTNFLQLGFRFSFVRNKDVFFIFSFCELLLIRHKWFWHIISSCHTTKKRRPLAEPPLWLWASQVSTARSLYIVYAEILK